MIDCRGLGLRLPGKDSNLDKVIQNHSCYRYTTRHIRIEVQKRQGKINHRAVRYGIVESFAPISVAIIMDGNGRWAQKRGLPRIAGHRRGSKAIQRILQNIRALPIQNLTLFAFSAENWARPREEVNALMRLLTDALRNHHDEFIRQEIGFRVIGCLEELPQSVQSELNKMLKATENFNERLLILALNYGSRTEIVDAVKSYTKAVQEGREDPQTLSWDTLSRYLYTGVMPDPDLIIRTSGEKRLSNFLLLQSAYAEMYFTPTLWPDFTLEELTHAIDLYKKRERRFGRTSEQIH